MTKLRLILALVALASVVGAYFYGRMDGGTACKATALTTYQKGVENNAHVDKQVNRMVEPELDRALSRWMQ
jgi:hypothetical protein